MKPNIFFTAFLLLITACGVDNKPTSAPPLPRILSITADKLEVPRYERIEFSIALDAIYDNPYDSREISVEATFTGPDRSKWSVPGFWDADDAWRIRFTPSVVGIWQVVIMVEDKDGSSSSESINFSVNSSPHHGWLQIGSWIDPGYNPRYLAYHDGTPFYGFGHCNAFNLFSFGYDEDLGFDLFNDMVESGENTLVYWPIYSNPFFSQEYNQYSLPDLNVIDLIVQDAEQKGIFLIFTIWNHDLLRDQHHPWSTSNLGQWEQLNGFRALGSIDDFFSSDEAWAWQENLYRYIIARWGYSPAIGMWQTISEIEGTNAFGEGDRWHERVNNYFVEKDPYRHPTTASMAGDQWWPSGYRVMDVLQLHSYESGDDTIETGPLLADWTQKMTLFESKPNFIGEFGTPNQRNQPEHLHNAIWSGLVNGAALTPMDWNDSGSWGSMTPEMFEQMHFFSKFVRDLDLVKFDTSILDIRTSTQDLQAWGIGGKDWGILWIQDVSQINQEISHIRNSIVKYTGETVIVDDFEKGDYRIQPFNAWEGVYLPELDSQSKSGQISITLPDFESDLVLKIIQK